MVRGVTVLNDTSSAEIQLRELFFCNDLQYTQVELELLHGTGPATERCEKLKKSCSVGIQHMDAADNDSAMTGQQDARI